jgi:hypothetical protein
MPGTLIFLGAGATKAAGGPLTKEILPNINRGNSSPTPPSDPQGRLTMLRSFLADLFHVDLQSSEDLYPGLPLVMSLLDTALDRRQSFHPNWDSLAVSQLREAIELGIFDLLEESLYSAQTNSHLRLLQAIYGDSSTAEPAIVSTNYDLLIDTALMAFSQRRFPDGRFPDYGCAIRTGFYRDEHPHFGSLLKLHGSLNWLYCKTCHRLEIGASESKKYIKVLDELVGPSLKKSYTPDGSLCLTCNTKLRPLLVTPTHFKDYRNPHLTQVWYEAERFLRDATKVVFIGYSLPEDDVEVIYLLKRSLANLTADRITVVESDPVALTPLEQHPVGRRYRALFGDKLDWHPEGMDDWLCRAGGIGR